MTFDELITVLEGLHGRMVEATIRTPYDDIESGSGGMWFGGFSGIVESLVDVEVSGTNHRTLYWRRDGEPKPDYGSVTIWRDAFERADTRASGQSVEEGLAEGAEEEDMVGMWHIDIYQHGLLIELIVYVM
ncbi:MAG TPA: hypothetical protein VJ204_10545 [Solirubrobacterales bacterium]|nr:hypothetical protein [Solirubrobacterales bacterium]